MENGRVEKSIGKHVVFEKQSVEGRGKGSFWLQG